MKKYEKNQIQTPINKHDCKSYSQTAMGTK
jgi:hypothetical protein